MTKIHNFWFILMVTFFQFYNFLCAYINLIFFQCKIPLITFWNFMKCFQQIYRIPEICWAIFVSICHKIKVYLRFVIASHFPLCNCHNLFSLIFVSIFINTPFSLTFNKSWSELKTTLKPLFIVIFLLKVTFRYACVSRHYYQVTEKHIITLPSGFEND